MNKNKLFTMVIAILLLTAFTGPAFAANAQDQINNLEQDEESINSVVFVIGLDQYFINGQTPGVKMSARPFTEKGRTFVPARYLSYALGLTDIEWDGSTQKITMRSPVNTLEMAIGSKTFVAIPHDMLINNNTSPSQDKKSKTIDAAPILNVEEGRIYLPLSFIAEALNYVVEWDNDHDIVLCYPQDRERPDISQVINYVEGVDTQPPAQPPGDDSFTKGNYIRINDTRLFYAVEGEGEPLVLLHGSFSDLRIWDYQVDTFAHKYKVVRYDHRGYGKSDVPESNFTYYNDLKSLIEALDLKRVSIVGSSMGGSVAIDFALEYPELVKSLILVGPSLNGYVYPPDYRTESTNLYLSKSEGPEAALEMFIANPYWAYFFPSPDRKEAREKVLQLVRDSGKFFIWDPRQAAVLEPYASERLKEIKIPTLVIWSDKDSDFNIEVGEYIFNGIENSKKAVMTDCGHLPYVEKPEEFNQIVLDFLEETI